MRYAAPLTAGTDRAYGRPMPWRERIWFVVLFVVAIAFSWRYGGAYLP
jgi:hypothetical protein